jgi:hypothetical protein
MTDEFTNDQPTIWSEGDEVERTNYLLDMVTRKRFTCAAVAAQVVRATLLLAGITLPILDVEQPYMGNAGGSTEDGKFILHGVETGTNPTMYAPPAEGEYAYKIKNSDGPDDDYDDHLYLYIVMNLDPENLTECYAQILTQDEISDVMNMDNVTDKDYQELVGALSGETDWQKQQRHIGSYAEKD